MREIEIKAIVRDETSVLRKLAELGCMLSEPVSQEDAVYAEKTGSLAEFLTNSVFLRIRQTPNETVFTLKYNPDRQGEPDAMPVEHEVTVSSRSELEAMFPFLNFNPMVTISKSRRQGHYQNWEICIDEVQDLGTFIEVEHMAEHDDDIEPVRTALMDFLRSLGIAESDLLAKRYDIQILERKFSQE